MSQVTSHKSQVIRAPLFLFASMLIASASAEANTIDLYQNFPDNQGDNGFYVYGRSPFQLLSDAGSYFFNRPGDQWNNPNVFKSLTVNAWNPGAPWIGMFPAGTMSQLGPDDPVLAYVAPETAMYQVRGDFYLYPQSLNGAWAWIYVNGSGRALDDNPSIVWQSFVGPGAAMGFGCAIGCLGGELSVPLNAGDTLYFVTDSYQDMYFSEYNDWLYLRGTITYTSNIPEPTIIDGDTLAPGGADPIGTVKIDGDLTLKNGADYVVDLDLAGLKSDYLGVDGTLNLGTDSLLDLNLINDLLLGAGKEFQIVGYGGWDGNYFKGFADGYQFNRGRNRWEIDYRPGGIYLTSLGAATVPEPSTLALMLLAAGLLGARRRRH